MEQNEITFTDLWIQVLEKYPISSYLIPKAEPLIKSTIIDGVYRFNLLFDGFVENKLICDSNKEIISNLNNDDNIFQALISCIKLIIAEKNKSVHANMFSGELKGQLSTKNYKDKQRAKESEVKYILEEIYNIRQNAFDEEYI